jgi:hypothetical protein
VADLRQAAELHRQAAAYVPRVWCWGADMGPNVQQGLVARETRRAIAAAVREAAALEALALDHVEAALRRRA